MFCRKAYFYIALLIIGLMLIYFNVSKGLKKNSGYDKDPWAIMMIVGVIISIYSGTKLLL
jgi:uncharacterized membrane protein YhaH (DUF805 family)